jgi:hypothetical protein
MNVRKTLTYRQLNTGNIKDVFPLLCPVRELDWLDGWQCTLVYSTSGLIEQGCVFTTPHHGKQETTWYVTQYDRANYSVEFVRVTPGESVVKINIVLQAISPDSTEANITYEYTSLSEAQNRFIETELEHEFKRSMMWWEKAINYYLKTGEKLLKNIM